MRKQFILGLMLPLVLMACNVKKDNNEQGRVKIMKPVITGEWQHIFNPNDTRSDIDTTWYTNDHCFAKGPDGGWHAYGIIGHKPINPWTGETRFFHISAITFNQKKWEDHDYALETKKGVERVLWAPHVFHEEKSDTWHMFYNIGNMQEKAPYYASWGQLCRADSKDMFNWERHAFNPLFSDPGHARDSYILKSNGLYYYYYTRTFNEVDLRSCVAVRASPDLKHWSGAKIVHTQPLQCDWGGDCESPYVVEKNGIYYLFICRAMTAYNQTHVYWSKDPMNFPKENFVCELPTHASEVIKVSEDEWYVSNTGWDKKGLFIARLEWLDN
ncbi:MAG: family 43 glycosylhydrolase [Marinilabiliaceae bacterium]|nr:family 43 glycosylhydrolase [Marinilabiliaceae bacterium]